MTSLLLNYDIAYHIVEKLDIKSLCRLMLVNKFFHDVVMGLDILKYFPAMLEIKQEIRKINWKIKFVHDVMNGWIQVVHVTNKLLCKQLEEKYPKYTNVNGIESYDYLLHMPVGCFTNEGLINFEKKLVDKEGKIDAIIDQMPEYWRKEVWRYIHIELT